MRVSPAALLLAAAVAASPATAFVAPRGSLRSAFSPSASAGASSPSQLSMVLEKPKMLSKLEILKVDSAHLQNPLHEVGRSLFRGLLKCSDGGQGRPRGGWRGVSWGKVAHALDVTWRQRNCNWRWAQRVPLAPRFFLRGLEHGKVLEASIGSERGGGKGAKIAPRPKTEARSECEVNPACLLISDSCMRTNMQSAIGRPS